MYMSLRQIPVNSKQKEDIPKFSPKDGHASLVEHPLPRKTVSTAALEGRQVLSESRLSPHSSGRNPQRKRKYRKELFYTDPREMFLIKNVHLFDAFGVILFRFNIISRELH